MFARMIQSIARRLGYMIIKPPESYSKEDGYVLHSYNSEDKTFDYDKYKKVQTEGNKRKLGLVWAIEDNIKFLAKYIQTKLDRPEFGLCHGTRRGMEQKWFSDILTCKVLGTEISDTAEEFPNTIQWDFHDIKPEWEGNVDFIFSNSFDHSYNPEKCLNAWMSCLRPGGLCILEHGSTSGLEFASELDPFGAELWYMPYLIAKWGGGRYVVREILRAPVKSYNKYLSFIIIQNFPETPEKR